MYLLGGREYEFDVSVVLHHSVELCNLITINVCAYVCPDKISFRMLSKGFIREDKMPCLDDLPSRLSFWRREAAPAACAFWYSSVKDW